MSISTKTGDDGTSGLLFNRRAPKNDIHFEAVGTVDELNAALGLVRAAAGPGRLHDQILRIQNELVLLMGELVLLEDDRSRYEQARGKSIAAEATDRLTALVHEAESRISLEDWVMPGNTPVGAALDFARTICRRAERRILALKEHQRGLNPELVCFFNRLSDLCFVWARDQEQNPPASAS
jgi:cob(I)alamin adenosyltransferase